MRIKQQRIRVITIWLISLLLMLLAHRLNAQTKTNSFYFEHEQNGNPMVTYIRIYSGPDIRVLATHSNNIASIYTRTVGRMQDDVFLTLDYWFGETNASMAPDAPLFMPFIPPPPSLAQILSVSNRLWAVKHPASLLAKPKQGNRPVVKAVAAANPPTPKPAAPASSKIFPPPGTPPTPSP